MKEKNTKRSFRNYRNYECDDFAAYLHEMAGEGWQFTGFGLGLNFKKAEPADIEYVVEIFPKNSESDFAPTEAVEEFAEYCNAAGYRFIDASGKKVVFEKLRDDAADITTPEERFSNIKKADTRTIGGMLIYIPVMIAIYLLPWLRGNVTSLLVSPASMLAIVFWTIYFFEHVVEFSAFLRCMKRAKTDLERGITPYYGRKNGFRIQFFYYIVLFISLALAVPIMGRKYLLTFFVIFVAVDLITIGIRSVMRPTKKEAILTTGVVTFMVLLVVGFGAAEIMDDNPKYNPESFLITPADLGWEDIITGSGDTGHTATILASEDYYDFYNYSPDSNYEDIGYEFNLHIYRSRYQKILDVIYKDRIKGRFGTPKASDLWHGNEAVHFPEYEDVSGCYVVRFDDAVITVLKTGGLSQQEADLIMDRIE